ncbi:MAG: hypothetical protein WD004_02140 [Actinomycetota bacterium]
MSDGQEEEVDSEAEVFCQEVGGATEVARQAEEVNREAQVAGEEEVNRQAEEVNREAEAGAA